MSAALAGGLLLGGCTPRNVFWLDSEAVIHPPPVAAASPSPAQGYLVVAMRHLGQPGDSEMEHFPPVYLYDAHGAFLRELPDNTENPMPVVPGDYILLVGDTDPMGEFHQLQIQVIDGETTAVSLNDIDHAPEFWALWRSLSK